MRMLTTACLVALLVCCSAWSATLSLYVSPKGKDTAAGSQKQPFATLQRARDEVRKLDKSQLSGVVVEVAAGNYELAEPMAFTAADSGTAQCPIEYRAAKDAEVRLIAGRIVTGWKPVSDPAVLERMAPAARAKVLQTDLKALGITNLQGINSAGTYTSDPGLEVFFQDKPMTLARYPNQGYMHIKSALDAEGNPVPASKIVNTPNSRFISDDARPAQWTKEKDIWLHGFWTYDWADSRIQLGSVDPATNTIKLGAANAAYGIRTGMWFYAQNVLPELDMPGEWYLDRDTSILYFWPTGAINSGKVLVSTVRDPLQLTDVSNVTFRGLTVEAGRGTAFVINGGSNVRIVGCTIRNMGNWAAKINGGTKHGVVGCDIYGTGQGGAYLAGGDRNTLTAAGHYADNNHIHHTSRWDPVYQQAIALRGVGNSATHNLIDNVPHIAIGFADNEMTIEYNEIHSAVFQSNDAGAIYTSPPDETWSMRGHKIRYNYLHNIHGFESRGCMGVYLDDCFSSADISSNIFYDVARGILIGGGRDNMITNNMFINCPLAFSIDARGLGWAKGVGTFATKELLDLNYRQAPWSIKYPELLNILEDDPLAPKGNVVSRNISWGGKWGQTEAKALPLVKFEDNLIDVDPKFVGTPPKDFRLAQDSPARKLGFRPIPFERIGVYKSADRASWPVTSTLRVDAPVPAAKPVPIRVGTPPVFDIPRRNAEVKVDGTLEPAEWFGLDAAKAMPIKEGVNGEKVAFPSKAWLAWDDEALYVAFDNAVDKKQPMGMEDAWGGNDAVEVAISAAEKSPILVLRGFANGAFQSTDEAGASAEMAKRAAQNVQYKAKVVDTGRWVAEMRIPFASLGFKPAEGAKHKFNISVRKQGDDPWVEWYGTGSQTWYLPGAGSVRFMK
jgi:parallel beta-helix repeat protein